MVAKSVTKAYAIWQLGVATCSIPLTLSVPGHLCNPCARCFYEKIGFLKKMENRPYTVKVIT